MKKYILKDDTINESEVQRVCDYKQYPTDSKVYSETGFVKIGDRKSGGKHWTC